MRQSFDLHDRPGHLIDEDLPKIYVEYETTPKDDIESKTDPACRMRQSTGRPPLRRGLVRGVQATLESRSTYGDGLIDRTCPGFLIIKGTRRQRRDPQTVSSATRAIRSYRAEPRAGGALQAAKDSSSSSRSCKAGNYVDDVNGP